MNNVALIGRLTRDPELRYVPGSGVANCRFNIAVDRGLSREKKQELEAKNQPTTDFINIVAWGKSAENIANYFNKGKMIAITGRIQTGSYEKNNQKIYTTDVLLTSFEFVGSSDKQSNDTSFDFSGIEGFIPTDNDDIPF